MSLEDFILGHCLEDASLLEENVFSLERLVDENTQECLKYSLELLSILYLEKKEYQRPEMAHRLCFLVDGCISRLASTKDFDLKRQVALGKVLVDDRRYEEALDLYGEIESHLQLASYQTYPLEKMIPQPLLETISPLFDDLVLYSAMALWRMGKKTSHLLSMWMDSSSGKSKKILSQLHWFFPEVKDVFPHLEDGRRDFGSFTWNLRCSWGDGDASSTPDPLEAVQGGPLQLLTLTENGRTYGRLISREVRGEVFNLKRLSPSRDSLLDVSQKRKRRPGSGLEHQKSPRRLRGQLGKDS